MLVSPLSRWIKRKSGSTPEPSVDLGASRPSCTPQSSQFHSECLDRKSLGHQTLLCSAVSSLNACGASPRPAPQGRLLGGRPSRIACDRANLSSLGQHRRYANPGGTNRFTVITAELDTVCYTVRNSHRSMLQRRLTSKQGTVTFFTFSLPSWFCLTMSCWLK